MPEPELIDAELSLLAFQHRVLALAADQSIPLLERLRFLGIVTSNLDELYMVRMAELRGAAIDERAGERAAASFHEVHGGSAVSRLEAIEAEVARLLRKQAECAAACCREAYGAGVGLVTWEQLSAEEQEVLRWRYLKEIQPDLMTHAITLSPGHALPHLPHLGLFVALVYREAPGDRTRLAEHELPTDIPRLLPVPGRDGVVIAIDELVRTFAHRLYPNAVVEGAWMFRVTRCGDLPLRESDSGDLLDAVARATELRPHNPAVRVEVERAMPPATSALILDSLHREAQGRDMEITVSQAQIIDGLLDQRCLQTLPLPSGHPFEYAPLVATSPWPSERSVFDTLREGDVLAHHPFDAFDETVVRFFQEAAHDPLVTSISTTLYRVGNPSPVVDALLHAAREGKSVFAFVELQARFDEANNVHWARTLERAGGRVVYGMEGLKVHAKTCLVTRVEPEGVRRYTHVGSGNYNTRSGRQYTDLSLFSARDDAAADVDTLFQLLSGARSLPVELTHGGLLAPNQLLSSLLARIAREAEHARAGRPARITIKVNGLADTEVVRALYTASQAGVEIDLIVRGICTLRPSVPGLSDRIRVTSVVGRWLEHSRVYRFANGGATEYFMGSADLRPRNLRRRVELLVPVPDPRHRAMLDELLQRYLDCPSAWELRRDGSYEQRTARPSTLSAQQQFARRGSAPVVQTSS